MTSSFDKFQIHRFRGVAAFWKVGGSGGVLFSCNFLLHFWAIWGSDLFSKSQKVGELKPPAPLYYAPDQESEKRDRGASFSKKYISLCGILIEKGRRAWLKFQQKPILVNVFYWKTSGQAKAAATKLLLSKKFLYSATAVKTFLRPQ